MVERKPTNNGRILRFKSLFAIAALAWIAFDVTSRLSVSSSTFFNDIDVHQQFEIPRRQTSIPFPVTIDSFNNTLISHDKSCGDAWSLPGLLTGERTSYRYQTHDEVVVNTTLWSHQRSGAPSAKGTITATISHGCLNGSSAPPLSRVVTKETVLCQEELQNDHLLGRTVVMDFTGSWDDVLGDASGSSLNMWHFHASVVRMWAGLKIGLFVVGVEVEDDGGSPWVVLQLPAKVFDRFQTLGHIFVGTPARILEHVSALGSSAQHTTHFEGLQGVSDIFHGQLLVMKRGVTTMEELQTALREQGANPRVSMWIDPPSDGLLWDLAWDKRLSTSLSNCSNSLLHQYRNDILGGLAHHDVKRPPNKHVCFLSRQRRSKTGSTDRGSLRNLSPSFLLQLLSNLGSPILITPSTAVRQQDNSQGGMTTRLMKMEKISIAEQLQFVYEECAVLLGVHGAGLTNTLGMRPGTTVIELQSARMSYQYFRNVARLVNDVSYSLVSTLDGDGRDHEVDMHTDEQGMKNIYDLVEAKLHESVQRQIELQESLA